VTLGLHRSIGRNAWPGCPAAACRLTYALLGDRTDGRWWRPPKITKECARARVPLQWAMSQVNLGAALMTLGERENGTARLGEAVAAYRDALQERTRAPDNAFLPISEAPSVSGLDAPPLGGCARLPAPASPNIFPRGGISCRAGSRRSASSCSHRGHQLAAAPMSSRRLIRSDERRPRPPGQRNDFAAARSSADRPRAAR
jgi:hypothetical protein